KALAEVVQAQESLDQVKAAQLATLRESPTPQALDRHFAADIMPGLAPLEEPLRALVTNYGHALRALVAAQESLDALRSLQERMGVEKGYSLSFIRRGADFSRSSRRLVARLAPNLHWTAATPALQQFLGRPMPDLSARSFLDVVHPDDVPPLARAFQDALRDGEGHNVTFRVLPAVENAPPVERHVQMDILTRYTNEGAPLHLRCHLLDVTEKVQTDRELRDRSRQLAEANERLRQTNGDLERLKEGYRDLYHHAPAMYFSLDPRGRFATCNETLLHSLSYTREELLNQPYTRVLPLPARAAYLGDPAVYKQPGEIETHWIKKDGTVIDVWIRTTPVQDAQGRFLRSRSAAQDVTERNRLLDALVAKGRELEQANAELRRINQELDQFTYVVSHDLKEPLRTLEAFSTFLAQDYGDRLGAEGQGFLEHLVEASRRLSALISDLLLLSQAGKVINTPRPIDLQELFRTVVGDLHDLIQRREAVIRLDEGAAGCPRLMGDPQRLAELLSNLVGNGLKYNTSAHPEVVIGYCPDGGPAGDGGRLVTLYVRDNGIGIEPRYHEQIFQMFRRLHRRDEYEGTGAGLAICRKIIEAHGGTIRVESAPGRGTTFFFTLPRLEVASAERRPAAAAPGLGGEGP
ncbi:MAG TPA: ATP-binding protein, partial [Gemmataceae bacterium]|nr:ATP-binding protein [Gemmataceae bacterium]